MENKKTEEVEIDLLHIAQVLARNAVVIILVAVIFGGIFYGATKAFVTPLYKASAYMYVNSSNLSVAGTKVSISNSELLAAQSLIETYSVILRTRMTLNEVIERSGVGYTYEELVKMIDATSVNGTEVFCVSVTSPDPHEAEMLANTIVDVLPDKIASVVDGSSVRIVDFAVLPQEKDSPSYLSNALKGAILGMLLTAALIVAIDLMDEQIHDVEYLTKTYDLPVLATIPDLLAKNGDYYYKSTDKRAQK